MTTPTVPHNARPFLRSHQPYTTPFLARISLFVSHAVLDSATSNDKSPHLDPNREILYPSGSTNEMCQRVLRLLNPLTIMFPSTDHPSPDTTPLALCLLFRYCVALASTSRRAATTLTYDVLYSREHISAPIPCYISTLLPATQPSDAMLLALSGDVAYRFLASGRTWLSLQYWVRPLEANEGTDLMPKNIPRERLIPLFGFNRRSLCISEADSEFCG